MSTHVLQDPEIFPETHLCDTCSVLFSLPGPDFRDYHPGRNFGNHHQSYENLLQSCNAGCQLCALLREGWDHFVRGQGPDPKCHSLATRGQDFLEIRVWSRTYSEGYDMQFKIDLYGPSQPGRVPSNNYFDSLSKWFGICTGRGHSACNTYRDQQGRERPRRLLYSPLADNHIKTVQLIEVQSEKSYKYATLSHRWGKGDAEPPKLSRNKDERDTFSYDTMIKGISTSALPRLFEQAFQIIRSCDLEYLWIDSLCIIQDKDKDDRNRDWEREAEKVGHIYAGGLFNIAAVGSEDARGSLFPRDRDFIAPVVRDSLGSRGENENGFTLVRVLADSDTEFERRVLSKELLSRGWVFQEVVLAPATLFCTEQQMWWFCHEYRYCQNLLTFARSYSGRFPGDGIHVPFSEGRDAIANKQGTHLRFYEGWGELLRLYVKTCVTRKDDRLVAIAGLSKVLEARYTGLEHAQYHSGLWSLDIITQLGWHTTSKSLTTNRYASDHFLPSWSPVSCNGEIKYSRHRCEKYQLPIECNFDGAGVDKFGCAKTMEQGILHLRGVPIEMTLGPVNIGGGKVQDEVWPSEYPDLTFAIRWDNQEEMGLAAQASSDGQLRALILTFWEGFPPEGLLLRSLRHHDPDTPDKWVRCGYLTRKGRSRNSVHNWEMIEAFQLVRYGIKWIKGKYGYMDTVPTGTAPCLEDIELV